jgi:hypothetical protein
VHSFRPSQRLSVIQFDIKRIVIRVTTQINEEVLRRAPGAGELLQADVFSKGVVSLVATIIADYYGNARCVASGRAASETSALFDWLQASPSGRSVSLPRPFWPSASPSQPSRMSASESLVELALSATFGRSERRAKPSTICPVRLAIFSFLPSSLFKVFWNQLADPTFPDSVHESLRRLVQLPLLALTCEPCTRVQ